MGHDQLLDAFIAYAQKNPTHAMGLAAAMLILIVESSIENQSGDKNREISIEPGPGQRKITIHALEANNG